MVKAQSSLEYMMLLALAGVLSVSALASTNGNFAVQKEFQGNAAGLLVNSTGFNNSGNYSPYSNATEPRLELRLGISQPAYAGQPFLVQAVIYNYGAPVNIRSLALSSANSSLSLTPGKKGEAPVVFSYALSSTAFAGKPGVYTVQAEAQGQNGVLRSFDGKPLRVNATFTVLSSQGGSSGEKDYRISIARPGEAVSYNLTPLSDEIYSVVMVTGPKDEGRDTCTSACPARVQGYPISALWLYTTWGGNGGGYAYNRCVCLYFIPLAASATIGSIPNPTFELRLNATSAANSAARFTLTQGKAFDSNQYGSLALLGSPIATSVNPSVDSIATAPKGSKNWTLRQLFTFNEYRSARADFESRLQGGWCSYDCNGALSAVSSVNAKAGALMKSVQPYNCTSNSTHISCSPAILSYPALLLSLNKSFLGHEIPCDSPDSITASGIAVEVTACR